MTKDIQRKL